MDRIHVKQVEGAVDTTSKQQIDGQKIFSDITACSSDGRGPYLHFQDGFLYWIQNNGILEETGNKRIGMDSTGHFLIQEFSEKSWISITVG